MTKIKKLSTGIFALALMSLCSMHAWAQTGKASPPKTASTLQAERAASNPVLGASTASPQLSKAAAAAELNNYKFDASNPELSNSRLALLKAKAELASGLEDKNLTSEQTVNLRKKIAKLESQVQSLSPASTSKGFSTASTSKDISTAPKQLTAVQTDQSNRSSSKADAIIDSKHCTRAQFLALTEVEQKQLVPHMQDITVTDLINATSADLKNQNVPYMTASDFKNADPIKQCFILQNPSSYLVIK